MKNIHKLVKNIKNFKQKFLRELKKHHKNSNYLKMNNSEIEEFFNEFFIIPKRRIGVLAAKFAERRLSTERLPKRYIRLQELEEKVKILESKLIVLEDKLEYISLNKID